MDRGWCHTSSSPILNDLAIGPHVDAKILDQHRQEKLAMQNTAHSLELFFHVFNNEVESLRLRLRDLGFRMRQLFSNSFRLDFIKVSQWITWLLNRSRIGIKPIKFECDFPRIIDESSSKLGSNLSMITLNDIEAVLTKDEIEYGIIHSSAIHFPAWKSLPTRIPPIITEFRMNDFQSFNKPVIMTTEDEDERLSLPSTHTIATEQENKILSLEAQLAVLSKQMQELLMSRDLDMKVSHSPLDSYIASDDEGKGTSLCSPAITKKEPQLCYGHGASLPRVAPPPGPPPPPPPPLEHLKSNRRLPPKSEHISSDKHRLSKDATEQNIEITRPTVFDLRAVQLKKTNTDRSPGGTPITHGRKTRAEMGDFDQACYLVKALREKFRSMNNSFSEQEDDLSSAWADED